MAGTKISTKLHKIHKTTQALEKFRSHNNEAIRETFRNGNRELFSYFKAIIIAFYSILVIFQYQKNLLFCS